VYKKKKEKERPRGKQIGMREKEGKVGETSPELSAPGVWVKRQRHKRRTSGSNQYGHEHRRKPKFGLVRKRPAESPVEEKKPPPIGTPETE